MKIINKINEARNYLTENSKTHLNNVAAKVIGFISILIGLGILGGAAYGIYGITLLMDVSQWKNFADYLLILPSTIMSLPLLAASALAIPCFQYGKDMLNAKFEVPTKPNDIERESL